MTVVSSSWSPLCVLVWPLITKAVKQPQDFNGQDIPTS